jgi:hypothetical protein
MAPSNHAVLSYWVKPNSLGYQTAECSVSRDDGTQTQTLAFGRIKDQWGMLVEHMGHPMDDDIGHERTANHSFYTQSGASTLPGMRWWLLTAHFDTDQIPTGQDTWLRMKGFRGSGVFNDGTADYGTPFLTASGEDLLGGGSLLVLGPSGSSVNMPGYTGQILDEFAIADFGDGAGGAILGASAWADQRYVDGRYYKGEDGAFLSTVLSPGPVGKAHLLRAWWTAWLPNEVRQELVTSGFVPPTGSPRDVDATLANARIDLELLEGSSLALLQPLSQGRGIGRTLQGFCYRARFHAALPNPLNQPVLETPFLDDVTFAWQPLTGPRVLGWAEGEP